MKMTKRLLCIFVFGTLVVGGLMAQQKQGYIKPTFGMGFAAAEGYSGAAMSFDVDFVNNFGLTLGLQDLFVWNSDGVLNPVAFGIGYTYNGGKWSAGGKFMAAPFEAAQVGGIGFDVNGTYWWKENLGATGIVDLYFPTDVGPVFSVRVGVSLKF